MKYIILSALWIGFGVLHSFLISVSFTDWLKKVMGKYYAFHRMAYNIVSVATFIPLVNYTNKIDATFIIKFVYPWNILQFLLLAGSACILMAAFFTYDPLEFLGIRQITGLFSQNEVETDKRIVRTGLLGIVRHPMYLAVLVFIWFRNVTLADVIVNLILTLYFIIGVKLEERKLVREDMIISHFRPTIGKRNAPDKLLVTKARLLKLQSNANEVASSPGMLFLAMKSIIIKKINIPIKLYATS